MHIRGGWDLGQYFVRAVNCIVSRDNEVKILWVPAHAGIAGSEEADRLAKEAAEDWAHEVAGEYRWDEGRYYQ